MCFYYTADTDNVPPFATVTLYLVPSGDFKIIPYPTPDVSISPTATVNFEVGLVDPIPTLPLDLVVKTVVPLGLSCKSPDSATI